MKPTTRISVKLDAEIYRALRQLGLDTNKSNQDIAVSAIKGYIAAQKVEG